jgi:tetratricopeptide (TPR) repeat protein
MRQLYKRAAFLSLIFVSAVFTLSAAKNDKNEGQISVERRQYSVDKDKVVMDFTIILDEVKIPSNSQLRLIPVLRSKDKSLELTPVIVNGKTRTKLNRRAQTLKGISPDKAYQTIDAASKTVNAQIPYRASIPYEEWHQDALLFLVQDRCGCGGVGEDYTSTLIADGLNLPTFINDMAPNVAFIVPPVEDPKKRDQSGFAYLDFKVDKWDILPDLFNNSAELAKIEKSLQYVNEEPTAVISAISITAYASPEGEYEHNVMLSNKRAEALANYVKRTYNIASGLITWKGKGENWDGLEEMILADNQIENKEGVLKIIRNVDIFKGREKKLMELSGGRPYNYMLKKHFPYLRRSHYKIDYTVPAFTVEKGKELLQTKPEMLSLNEMYLIAITYPKGSPEFNNVFVTALKSFPNDKIANLNAASAEILIGNYDEAKNILQNYKNEPDAWNNLGVVYMHENNFQEAEVYLKKAYDNGDGSAEDNLQTLERLKKKYNEFLKHN